MERNDANNSIHIEEEELSQPKSLLAQEATKEDIPILTDKELRKIKRASDWTSVKRNYQIYLMLLPGILYFLVFKYLPMGGLIIAFQDYQPHLGIFGSQFVGLKHFIRLFTEPTFWTLLTNTLVLFVLNMVFFFPLPIIVALMINAVRKKWLKNAIQTAIYVPHFMSWVIIVSITFVFLNKDNGVLNEMIASMGGEKIGFLTSPFWFRVVYVGQIIWRELGWSTIVYLAAITAVDIQLYEAADIDGCGRFGKIWHVTLPAIRGTIITLFILKIGRLLDLGFEHIYLLLNSLNRSVAEIFDTYIYTTGIKDGQFSFATAMSMFKGVVGLIMVVSANKLANKFDEDGVY